MSDRRLGYTCMVARMCAAAVVTMAAICSGHAVAQQTLQYAGVNLAGAEFGRELPGEHGRHYIYPTAAEVDYFVGKGMNIFRLPFMWERLQRQPFAELDAAELSLIEQFVEYATTKGAAVIIDPHNHARYYDKICGSAEAPAEAFADFWERVAAVFKNRPGIIFGLVNEPYDMPTEQWRDCAQAAIDAIRRTGAANLILVPGTNWSSAADWNRDYYGTPNAEVMLTIADPADNYAFEAHTYLDKAGSGEEICVSASIGSQRLAPFTDWLRKHGKRGFLGEFAGGRNELCYLALDDTLNHLDENADVWLGWTYWAAGPWWDEYMFTLEPINGEDRPQMAILLKHLPEVSASRE